MIQLVPLIPNTISIDTSGKGIWFQKKKRGNKIKMCPYLNTLVTPILIPKGSYKDWHVYKKKKIDFNNQSEVVYHRNYISIQRFM